MPYVIRDPSGRIAEVHATMPGRPCEEVPPADAALREFLGGGQGAGVQVALDGSDRALIRVIEDLITVLIDKRLIALTDLPKAAQQKLAQRYRLRSRLSDLQGIVGDLDEISLP